MATVKEEAADLVARMPDGATWSDLIYSIYVRRSIEAGLADVEAGRTYSTEEMLEFFGLKHRPAVRTARPGMLPSF